MVQHLTEKLVDIFKIAEPIRIGEGEGEGVNEKKLQGRPSFSRLDSEMAISVADV